VARILVVDHDPLFLAIMSRSLERARHDIVTASDGAKAIELFDKLAFDAVVCDLVLPHQSGLHVIRHARHGNGDVAIIMVTSGKANGKDVHVDVIKMAQAAGADGVVKKPFEMHDFVAVVESAIAERKQNSAALASG
jgi:DNA-binding response OmpR family regulator